MAEGLPEGLVVNNHRITGEIERVDRVVVEDITKLWKGIVLPMLCQAGCVKPS